MELFDPAESFNDDYLWFYEPILGVERNRHEASEIVAAVGLLAILLSGKGTCGPKLVRADS